LPYATYDVVIKLKERGCFVQPAGERGFVVEALPARVVDTTGAGDSFGKAVGNLVGRTRSSSLSFARWKR
jgi:sugar/nucleoside kinase (ribokinase family)